MSAARPAGSKIDFDCPVPWFVLQFDDSQMAVVGEMQQAIRPCQQPWSASRSKVSNPQISCDQAAEGLALC